MRPIELPSGVEFNLKGDGKVKVKGPKGDMRTGSAPHGVRFKQEDNTLIRGTARVRNAATPMAGTFRSLVNNMVVGVSAAASKRN